MRKTAIILSVFVLFVGGCGQTRKKYTNNLPTETVDFLTDTVAQTMPIAEDLENLLPKLDVAEENFQENKVWICKDTTTVVFHKFQADTLIMNFNYTPFVIRKSHKINDLKLLFGYYIDPKYYSKTDYGERLLCFNAQNQIVFKSRSSFDSFLYIPYFYVADDKKQFIILCQMGDEMGNMGAEVFLIEKNNIYFIGNISEPYDKERYSGDWVVSIVSIKRINNTLEFSFPNTLVVQEDRDIAEVKKVKLDIDFKYVYNAGKLTIEKMTSDDE